MYRKQVVVGLVFLTIKFNKMIMLIWSKHCFALVSMYNDFENIPCLLCMCMCMYKLTWCSALNQYHLVFDCTIFVHISFIILFVFYCNWNQAKKNRTGIHFVDEKWKKNKPSDDIGLNKTIHNISTHNSSLSLSVVC